MDGQDCDKFSFVYLNIMKAQLLGRIADTIKACRLLDGFHAQGRIHGSLQPGSFRRDISGQIKALAPPEDGAKILSSDPARLRYTSPEQAGRLVDQISARSDLYSLGVILYEWLVTVPPFESPDPMELVHGHLARLPVPPAVHRPNIPGPLSDIVLKLLAKKPADRYATAQGLVHDLEGARQRIESPDLQIRAFTLGSYDAATRFALLDKLYGREQETLQLLSLYKEAVSGTRALCLISGYSGVGKTALVQSLIAPVRTGGGAMVTGRYDQFHRQIPYSAFIQVFQTLIFQVLGGSESDIAAWRQRFLTAAGDDAQVAADLLPDLARIIGPQPVPISLTGTAAEQRFKAVFGKLFNLFTGPGKPLIVFLDDLQWADFASFSLIQHFLTSDDATHVLIIGAYRDNEVDAAHPLPAMVAELRRRDVSLTELVVGPLAPEHLGHMLEDACQGGLRDGRELVSITLEKTGGNPFYTRQFLTETHRSGFIFCDPKSREWYWDRSAVRSAARAENVIDLLSRRMAQLPENTRHLLRFAACAGQQFDLDLLSTILGLTPTDALADLAPALHDELIEPIRGATALLFRFVHDRVQQAAHALKGSPDTSAIHLAIGRRMLADSPQTALNDHLFVIADHLNQGVTLVTRQADCWHYARLNLRAGRKAKDALAYQAAARYFDAGRAFLPDDAWEKDFSLAFDMGLQAAEIADFINNTERFNTLCTALESRCRTPLDHYEICYRRIRSANRLGNFRESVELCRQGLCLFGIDLPPLDNRTAIQEMFLEQLADFRAQTKSLTEEDLKGLPQSSNPAHEAVLRLIESVSEATGVIGVELYNCLCAIGASRSVRFGHAGLSPTMYVMLCSPLMGNLRAFSEARKMASVYLYLIRQPGVSAYEFNRCMVNHMWNINYYIEHLEAVFPLIQEIFTQSLKSHDMASAALCRVFETLAHYVRGHNLDDAVHSGDTLYKICTTYNVLGHISFSSPFTAAAKALRGETAAIDDLNWSLFDEEDYRKSWESEHNIITVWTIAKMSVLGFAGQFARIIELAPGFDPPIPGTNVLNFEWHFWIGVACAVTARQAETAVDIQARLTCLDQRIAFFDDIHQYAHAPNVEARLCFLKAERARCGQQTEPALDLYRAAARSAADNRFTLLQGLVHETLAAFQLDLKHFDDSRASLEKAYTCYRHCHANALLPRIKGRLAALGARPVDEPETAGIEPLDAIAVVRAVQALSAEVDPQKLLRKVLDLLVEFAGAERGCVVTVLDHGFKVEQTAGAGLSDLPGSLFRYVLNTGLLLCPAEPVAEPAICGDPYVAAQRPSSLYCRPLGKQGTDSRVLYLEHRSLAGVFQSRLKTIEMIASQAGTSIEIAELHASLESKVEERTRELHTKQVQLETIIDNLPALFFMKDLEGRYLMINHLWEFSTGMGKDRVLGYTDREIFPPEVAEAFIQNDRKVAAGDMPLTLEEQAPHPDGSLHDYLSMKVPLSDDQGMTTAIIGMATDITELKTLQQELVGARDAAETANKAKSTFLANMSHELRTPLNAILGYAQILKGWTSGNANVVEGLEIIHRSGDHLLTLINDVLDQSKIEAGKLELDPTAFDLEDFLRQIIGIVRAKAEAKEISLGYEPLTALPEGVFADETRLRQVLLNLLGNAVKFTGEGKVTLTAEVVAEQENSGRVEVSLRFGVEDTGVGISPEDLAGIFKPFEQVGERAKHAEGTGLGLAISRQIVELMGGELKVASTAGKGSRFWFDVTLPTVAAETSTTPKAHLIQGYDGPRRRILVVDDKSYNRQVLGTMLQSLGFLVSYAFDGRDGLEQALAQRPDVILLDLLMPVMTGIEAVKQIRSEKALQGVIVIAVSASVLEEEQEESLAAGCNAFLPKPVQVRELYVLLAEYLDLDWQYADTAGEDPALNAPLVVPPPKILLALGELTDLYDYAGLETALFRLEQEDVQYKPFVHKIREWARVFDMQSIQTFFQEKMSIEREDP